MKSFITKKENQDERGDKVLTSLLRQETGLGNIPRSFVSRVFETHVLINEKKKKASYRLKTGDRIVVNLEVLREKYVREQLKQELESKIIAQKGVLDIVFEDSDCLVLRKQSGLVVHPGIKNEKDTLANYVKGYLMETGKYDEELKRAGIVHRLDKGVAGLILFAKNREAQKHFASQFEKHKVLKIYYAEYVLENSVFSNSFKSPQLVNKVIDCYKDGNSLELTDWNKVEGVIRRDPANRKRMVFYPNSMDERYRYAKSYVLPISEGKMFVLIETGRMHQIRATLKSLGLVLKGDTLYGYKGKTMGDKIALNSVVLGFEGMDRKRKVFNIINKYF